MSSFDQSVFISCLIWSFIAVTTVLFIAGVSVLWSLISKYNSDKKEYEIKHGALYKYYNPDD